MILDRFAVELFLAGASVRRFPIRHFSSHYAELKSNDAYDMVDFSSC